MKSSALPRRKLRQTLERDPANRNALSAMVAMLENHDVVTQAEFKRLCVGLGAEVSPPEAAEVFNGVCSNSSGTASLETVLQLLMAPEMALKMCRQLKKTTAGGPDILFLKTGRSSEAQSRPSALVSHRSGSRAATPCATKDRKGRTLPWKQRQAVQLVPDSHRDFMMQTKPQMDQSRLRAHTPPLISSRSRASSVQSMQSSRSAKTPLQGKKWKWPSNIVSEKPRGLYKVPRTPKDKLATCLLHERDESLHGFEHEWVWREANVRKQQTNCLLDYGLKGEYRDYMATKYGVTT